MDPKLKIISDHLRSSAFLIADGIMPSNEGRGYVLRRIMRRALLQIHKIGAKDLVMYKLVEPLIKQMGQAYPELITRKETIIDILKNEEEKFRQTIDKGLKILEEELQNNKSSNFSGQIAFKLYDTYGFPLDLTQDLLKEQNITVNIEEFNKAMSKQKALARQNWSGSGQNAEEEIFFDLKNKFGPTKFVGYDKTEICAQILHYQQQEPAFIILDQTPFYATSGGQKGDDGFIILANEHKLEIIETKKFADDLFVHFIKKAPDLDLINANITAQINKTNRAQRSANHSATHLMHKALKLVLGNVISQKGSNVDSDYFTFDFNFNRQMTPEEITKVEEIVNEQINKDSTTNTKIMDLKQAQESKAECLFGEKYDDKVRVVSIGNSVELCGGTHVSSSKEIESFKIISEKSIASGIRRIEAKTGLALKNYLAQKQQEEQIIIDNLKNKISKQNDELNKLKNNKITNIDLNDKNIEQLENIAKQNDKQINKLRTENLSNNLDDLTIEKIADINFISHNFGEIKANDLREISTKIIAKDEFKNSSILISFAINDDKVSTCIAISDDITTKFDASKLIKIAVEKINGKGGGGKANFAMGGGNSKENIDLAINAVKNCLKT